MEDAIEKERLTVFIERLYCRCCNDVQIYREFKEYLTMKLFAESIGGEFYGYDKFHKLEEKITELGLADLLPGRKRQLSVTGNIGVMLLRDLYPNTTITPIQTSNAYMPQNKWYGMGDSYYVCKSCCEICRFQSRGCTIHCRTCFCDFISLMGKIDTSKLIFRNSKVSDKNIKKFISFLDVKFGKNKQLHSTGYIRSLADIAVYIFERFELEYEEAFGLVQNISNNAMHLSR